MRATSLVLVCIAAAFAQESTTSETSSQSVITLEGTRTISNELLSGTPSYITYTTTQTRTTSSNETSTDGNNSTSTSTSTDGFPTLLVGTNAANETGSQTSTAELPTNTQPCNGHVEFCNRKYSNITMVAAHNSPFITPNNVAANQDFGVFSQLNDGIRMLQGQAHMWNGELRYCHTSCDLLDAGSVEEYFTNVTEWLRNHPFEVVTILIGNAELTPVEEYVTPIQNAGMESLIYVPPKVPMALEDWPTLGELILTGKRVIMFMDYNANQESVDYILDEFSQLWETPFSPTDPEFPCNVDRPPELSEEDARNRLYMTNHNLNVDISVAGLSILVPNTVDIDSTNADTLNDVGNLGRNNYNCTAQWDRPPNFLLVDYYNRGNFNGSVFAVAATANGVEYNAEAANCCGENDNVNGAGSIVPSLGMLMAALVFAMGLCI